MRCRPCFEESPSQENFQALCDGISYKIDYPTFQEIYHLSPGFNEWGRAWMSEQLLSLEQRHIDLVRLSASDRYLKLLKGQPQVVQQASLKHIASFLDNTGTSLSPIRKEVFQN